MKIINKSNIQIEDLMRTIFRMYSHCIKVELNKNDIKTASHPPILFLLRDHSSLGPLSQTKIAEMLGISAPTVAISIKRMEKCKLIKKVPDESDLRRNLITLTQDGLEFVNASERVFQKINKEMFGDFTNTEKAQLFGLFEHIISNLEKMGAHSPKKYKTELN